MKLNPREILFLAVGALALAATGLYFLVIEPLSLQRDKYHNLTSRLQEDLDEMQVLADQYKALAIRRDEVESQIKARGEDFAPFGYLENVARETGVSGKIESITPVTVMAEDGKTPTDQFDIRIAGIRVLELVRFLYKLESSDKVFFVENMSIKPRYLTPHLLDVTLRLTTPKAA